MWVPEKFRSWFEVSKEAVESQREEIAVLRSERDSLKIQVAVTQNHFDWLRTRVNILEVERAQLLEKAYGIKTIVPEIIRASSFPQPDLNSDLFTDIGDKAAKELGFPVYNN